MTDASGMYLLRYKLNDGSLLDRANAELICSTEYQSLAKFSVVAYQTKITRNARFVAEKNPSARVTLLLPLPPYILVQYEWGSQTLYNHPVTMGWPSATIPPVGCPPSGTNIALVGSPNQIHGTINL